MEAKSALRVEARCHLTTRSLGERNEEEIMWIADADAEQCAAKEKVWHAERTAGRRARREDFLGSKSSFTKFKIASAVAAMSALSLPSTLEKENEAALIEDDNQCESLLHPCQAIDCDCKFNLTLAGCR